MKRELKTIGSLISEQRKQQGLSRRELARLARVSVSSLTRIEQGNGTTLLTLYRLGRILGQERSIQRWFFNLFGGL